MQDKKRGLKGVKISSTFIIIIIMLLVLICSFVLFFEVNDYRKYKEEKHDFYYYFINDRIDFEGNIILNSNDNIISISADNLTFNSTPLYFAKEGSQMILPADMEIIYPYKGNPMYKLGKYSKVYYKGNYLYINSEAGNGRLYDCFLYDGNDLYVFMENTSVFVGDKRYDLNPLSFVEVTLNYIKIYDYHNDEYIYLDSYSGIVTAYTDEYFIDLSSDTFTYNDKYYLLIRNISGLDFYSFN